VRIEGYGGMFANHKLILTQKIIIFSSEMLLGNVGRKGVLSVVTGLETQVRPQLTF